MNPSVKDNTELADSRALGAENNALNAIAASAAALNSDCAFDEADELLRDTMFRYPREAVPVEQYAILALQRGDWHCATERAKNGRTLFPERPASYQYGLQAEYELLHLEEATVLQRQAERLFPDAAWPLTHGAQVAEAREDWIEAEGLWEQLCNRFPSDSTGWLERAAFRLRAGRLEAAGETLRDALKRFPRTPEVYIAYTQLVKASGLYAEAEQLWATSSQRFPSNLIIAQRHAEAPVEVPINKRWDLAASRYDELHRKFPNFAFGYVRHVMLLIRSGHVDGAEKLAETSLVTLRKRKTHADLTLEYAKLLERRGAVERAIVMTAELTNDLPNSVSPYIALSAILTRLARFDEAEAICEKAIARFKFRALPLVEYARIATQRGNLEVALERGSRVTYLVPRDKTSASELFITRLAIAEKGGRESIGVIPFAVGSEQRHGSLASIMMQFESLGGPAAGGCEFGFVQRNFGAEPIGLLRWASLSMENLVGALGSRFEGVGLADQTLLTLPGIANGDTEYHVNDIRFGIDLHAFIMQGDVSVEKLHQQWCARLKFLTRKLISDLETGKKIFLYRPGVALNAEELKDLGSAMRAYGDNLLLVIQTEDVDHRNGMVEFISPHVMIGYIDRLNWGPNGVHSQPSYSSWARICSGTLTLCNYWS